MFNTIRAKKHSGFFKFLGNQGGFTMVEMISSIAIIVILSGIFLANYRSSSDRSQLALAAQKLASDIRLAQNRSLGSFKKSGVIPNGGWGVYFNKVSSPNSYIIFADDNYPDEPNHVFDQSEISETILLPKGISLIHAGNEANIVFEPPSPTTFINGSDSGVINITLTDGKTSKTVLVNFFGLVEVLN